ncbi:MAG: hypothetical protein Q9186_002183 [Xanthomendoza sp. 1 TL-2023]
MKDPSDSKQAIMFLDSGYFHETFFPHSSVKLEPVISAGDWFVFENPEPDSEITAAYSDDIVGEKLEFAGRLFMSQYRDGKPSVYINSGHGPYGVTLGMGSGEVMSQLVLGKKRDVNVSNMGVSFDS